MTPSFLCAFPAAACAVALAGPALAAPPPALIPAQPGESATYRYTVDEHGPRGDTSTESIVIVSRVAPERAIVTLVPRTGSPSAVAMALESNGAPVTSTVRAADPTIPTDGPILGLPGAPGTGGSFGAPRAASSVPLAFRAVDALLAAGSTTPPGSHLALSLAGNEGTISLAGTATRVGTGLTLSADGTGPIEAPAAQQRTESGGYGGGNGRGYPRGGYPGGGNSGGGYPGGGRRGGTQDGGAPQSYGARTTANGTIHVEAMIAGGRFTSARGTETAGTGNAATTRSWRISRF